MTIKIDVKRGLRRARLDGELNIYSAPEFKRELLDQLTQASVLEIDLTQVNEFDSAGLQLLHLLRREALSANKTLHVVSASPAVREVFELYGLAAELADTKNNKTRS